MAGRESDRPRPRIVSRALPEEAKVRRAEIPHVRENGCHASRSDAEPLRQSRPVLVHGRRGNQRPPIIGVQQAAERLCRELAEELATLNPATHYEMVATPSVVGPAVAVGR